MCAWEVFCAPQVRLRTHTSIFVFIKKDWKNEYQILDHGCHQEKEIQWRCFGLIHFLMYKTKDYLKNEENVQTGSVIIFSVSSECKMFAELGKKIVLYTSVQSAHFSPAAILWLAYFQAPRHRGFPFCHLRVSPRLTYLPAAADKLREGGAGKTRQCREL